MNYSNNLSNEAQPTETWFKRFIKSPYTQGILGLCSIALLFYMLFKLTSNHKETMLVLGDIIKSIPSIRV